MKMKAIWLGVVMGIVGAGYAGTPAEDFKSFLKKFVPQCEKALRKEDIGFFEKCTTPDFTYTEIKGNTQPKAPALAGLKSMFDMSSNIKVKLTYSGATQKGDMGVVTMLNKWSMDTKGPDGKPAKMTMTAKTKESYKRINGKWMLHKITETGVSDMTMNGKPFDPEKMAPPPPSKKGG